MKVIIYIFIIALIIYSIFLFVCIKFDNDNKVLGLIKTISSINSIKVDSISSVRAIRIGFMDSKKSVILANLL